MAKNTITEAHLGQLMDTYGTEILRLCYLYLRDYQLAEDACQDTFIKVYHHFYQFKGLSSERTWITKIAINTCNSYLRNPWKRKVILPTEANALEKNADTLLFDELESSELFQAILQLKKIYKDVILMYYYQAFSVSEIATILGISEYNAFTRLCRARKLLKEELGGLIYE